MGRLPGGRRDGEEKGETVGRHEIVRRQARPGEGRQDRGGQARPWEGRRDRLEAGEAV